MKKRGTFRFIRQFLIQGFTIILGIVMSEEVIDKSARTSKLKAAAEKLAREDAVNRAKRRHQL